MARSVLDAWAVIALLRAERASPAVVAAIEEGAICSWINLGEALYKEARAVGWERADEAIGSLARNLVAEPAGPEIVRAAAAIKARHAISYADCFAVATAERHAAPLVTADPEIVALDRPSLEVRDLRR